MKKTHRCQHQDIITAVHFTLNTEAASSKWLIPETQDLYSTAEGMRNAHLSCCVSLFTHLCIMVLQSGSLQAFNYAGFTQKKKINSLEILRGYCLWLYNFAHTLALWEVVPLMLTLQSAKIYIENIYSLQQSSIPCCNLSLYWTIRNL